jgi:phage-related protein
MFDVLFYENRHGGQPVREMLDDLRERSRTSKDARVQYEKIATYINVLAQQGTRAGLPYMRHLEGAIWELRPISHRVLFFYWDGQGFVLLHHFIKKSQKTPAAEIEQAKRRMKDWEARNDNG